MTRVLLHCCCAPCSSAILEWMMDHDIEPVIFYCNPNIYPQEEYDIRKNEITRYAQQLGLTIIDDDYDHAAWLDYIKGLEDEPERGGRCLECFKFRLLRSARKARELGIATFTTTLASSRWKRLEQINAAGHWAAEQVNLPTKGQADVPMKGQADVPMKGQADGSTSEQVGAQANTLPAVNGGEPVRYDDRNWRKGGLQERRNELLRINGFYNQQYCGCEFSLRARQAQDSNCLQAALGEKSLSSLSGKSTNNNI